MCDESVRDKHLQRALVYLQQQKYGRSFSHFVQLLDISPQLKEEVQNNFVFALKEWGLKLERNSKMTDMFHCYEKALQLYPNSEQIHNNLGGHLFRLGLKEEAALYFKKSLEINPNYLETKKNLQNTHGALVERWHYRMLNDIQRNQAYCNAICRAAGEGHQTVLDIGSGTGILSMFAVQAGAKYVYACEMSRTMYEMSCDILAANNMLQDVPVLQLHSTAIRIGSHIPQRVSLVVTETMDAGLLGEHILSTLQHAWDELLIPPDSNQHYGQVIPQGATVYACIIECPGLRNQKRFFPTYLGSLDLTDVEIRNSASLEDSEPYTTENLRSVPGGYRRLSNVQGCMEFDFNDPDKIDWYVAGFIKTLELYVTSMGTADAIAMWFDLHLDYHTTISTAPEMDSCWEQAIFPITELDLQVSEGDEAIVEMRCQKDQLRLKCYALNKQDGEVVNLHNPLSPSNPPIILDPEMIGYLNATSYFDACCRAISEIQSQHLEGLSVLNMTNNPFIGLEIAKREIVKVGNLIKMAFQIPLLQRVAEKNGIPEEQITPVKERDLTEGKQCWDVVIVEPLEQCGLLKEDILENVALVRSTCLSPSGLIMPQSLIICAILIDSVALWEENAVLDNSRTLGLDIARFINEFSVTFHQDLDLSVLPHTKLTNPFQPLVMDFDADVSESNLPAFLNPTSTATIEITSNGLATAMVYWFQMKMSEHLTVSTLDWSSSWKQAAVILETKPQVFKGQSLTIETSCVNGYMDVKILT